MKALIVAAVVSVAAMMAAGCGPKKEETVPWDPALATAVATPAEGAPAVTETPLPPVEPAPTPAPKVEKAPPTVPAKTKAKTSAAETAAKPKAEKAPRGSQVYTVKAGDTLSGIAKRFYHDANQWKKIADANKDKIHNKTRIIVGMVLTIPPK